MRFLMGISRSLIRTGAVIFWIAASVANADEVRLVSASSEQLPDYAFPILAILDQEGALTGVRLIAKKLTRDQRGNPVHSEVIQERVISLDDINSAEGAPVNAVVPAVGQTMTLARLKGSIDPREGGTLSVQYWLNLFFPDMEGNRGNFEIRLVPQGQNWTALVETGNRRRSVRKLKIQTTLIWDMPVGISQISAE